MSSATITFRIPEEIKKSCKDVLKQNGMSVSDYCKLCIEYLVQTGKPAVRNILVADEDKDLEEIVRYRLQNPETPVRVKLDDLQS